MKTTPNLFELGCIRFVRLLFSWAFPEVGAVSATREMIFEMKTDLARWRKRRDEAQADLSKFRYALAMCDQLYWSIAALEEAVGKPNDKDVQPRERL